MPFFVRGCDGNAEIHRHTKFHFHALHGCKFEKLSSYGKKCPRPFFVHGYHGNLVSWASRIFPTCTHARMTSGRGNPHGKIRLGTLDRLSCPSPECWADQSDCSNALIAFHVTRITINSVSHK